MAVKGAIFDYPWATAGFGLDSSDLERWWPRFTSEVTMPVYWCVQDGFLDALGMPSRPFPACLRLLRRLSGPGLSDVPSEIYGGGTSGYGALGLAYLKGARQVVLFGYDYCRINGEWHASEKHYAEGQAYHEERWEAWARFVDVLAPQLAQRGMQVINASPASAITGFSRVTVEEGIALCGG